MAKITTIDEYLHAVCDVLNYLVDNSKRQNEILLEIYKLVGGEYDSNDSSDKRSDRED